MTKQIVMEKFGKSIYGIWMDIVIALIQDGKSVEDAFAQADVIAKKILDPGFDHSF